MNNDTLFNCHDSSLLTMNGDMKSEDGNFNLSQLKRISMHFVVPFLSSSTRIIASDLELVIPTINYFLQLIL